MRGTRRVENRLLAHHRINEHAYQSIGIRASEPARGERERFHFTSCPPKRGAALGLPPLCRNLQQISHDLDARLKSFGRGRIERQIRDGAGVSEALRFNLRQQRDEGMLGSDSFPFASNHDLMFKIS